MITIVLATLLIPVFGYIGAAATASSSYVSSVIYQYIIFKKETKTSFNQWIPTLSDFHEFRIIITNLLSKK